MKRLISNHTVCGERGRSALSRPGRIRTPRRCARPVADRRAGIGRECARASRRYRHPHLAEFSVGHDRDVLPGGKLSSRNTSATLSPARLSLRAPRRARARPWLRARRIAACGSTSSLQTPPKRNMPNDLLDADAPIPEAPSLAVLARQLGGERLSHESGRDGRHDASKAPPAVSAMGDVGAAPGVLRCSGPT
jgi:hypothetical protein